MVCRRHGAEGLTRPGPEGGWIVYASRIPPRPLGGWRLGNSETCILEAFGWSVRGVFEEARGSLLIKQLFHQGSWIALGLLGGDTPDPTGSADMLSVKSRTAQKITPCRGVLNKTPMESNAPIILQIQTRLCRKAGRTPGPFFFSCILGGARYAAKNALGVECKGEAKTGIQQKIVPKICYF